MQPPVVSLRFALYALRFALLRLFVCIALALFGIYLVSAGIFSATSVGLTLLLLGSIYWIYLHRPLV